MIYTAAAGDPDKSSPNNSITWSVAGADSALVDIDPFTGAVTLKSSADYETKRSYHFNVVATDRGTPALSDSKAVTIDVTNINEAPTVAGPAALIAFEDVDQAISGFTVADPDGDRLTVTLSVNHGTLKLDSASGVAITAGANGSSMVRFNGTTAELNAALATLTFCGSLNFGGNAVLSITASDDSLYASSAVTIHVQSAMEQATNLQTQVTALQNAGMLNQGQANALRTKLNLEGNNGDIGKVQAFLNQVGAWLDADIPDAGTGRGAAGPGPDPIAQRDAAVTLFSPTGVRFSACLRFLYSWQ